MILEGVALVVASMRTTGRAVEGEQVEVLAFWSVAGEDVAAAGAANGESSISLFFLLFFFLLRRRFRLLSRFVYVFFLRT
jgi:hypothetical protein